MKKLRKFLNASVMVMTILAMSGLGMFTPNFAKAAASAGDLIKMEGNSSVYYFDGAKRFVFPNEATYFSWYSDFSGVVTIPSSELQSYLLGGNVVMRPGTKLVKITTDPKVYAVEANGVLRHVQTEAQAIALYGTDWAKRVVDVPDAFFTNYTIGTPLASGNVPAGSLVKNAGSASVYYYDGTNYRSIASEAAMNANRLSFANVLTITNPITAGGNAITGMETAIVKTSQGGTTTGPVITGSGLMVSLNSATPASMNIPGNSPVEFLKINLTAANDGPVNVSSIKLTAYGLSAATKIDDVAFYDNGVKVGSNKDINSDRVAIFNFATPIYVAAGTTKTLAVKATISDTAGSYGLGIAAAADILSSGASVSGSFPVQGNIMSATAASIGSVKIDSATVTNTVNFGEDNVVLADFTLEAGSEEDALVQTISLYNAGTNDNNIVSNLKLVIDGDEVATGSYADRYVTFSLNNYEILKGKKVNVEVRGDMGVTSKNDTVALYLKSATDLVAIGKTHGFTLSVDYSLFPNSNNVVTLNTGDITIDMDKTATPTKDVKSDVDDVVLATLILKSNGEDITISAIDGEDFYINTKKENPDGLLENIELVDKTNGGIYDLSTATSSKKIELSLDDEINLVKGVAKTFEVRADILAAATEGETFTVAFESDAMTLEGDTSGATSFSITPSSVTGSIITVKEASLTLTPTVLNNANVVGGAKDVVVYQAKVKAGTADAVRIQSFKLTSATSTQTNSAFTDSNVSKLSLWLNGKLLKEVSNAIAGDSTTANGTITFSSLNSANYTVAAGAEYDLVVKADFAASVTAGDFKLKIATDDDMTVRDADSNSVTPTIAADTFSRVVKSVSAGTLNIALVITGANASRDSFLLAGSQTEAGRYLGEIKFTTANEAVKVEKFALATTTGHTATNADLASVKLVKADGTVVATGSVDADGDVTFDPMNVVFDADKTTSLYIVAVAKGINVDGDPSSTASSGKLVRYKLGADADITAIGNASGEAISETKDGTTDSKTATIVGSKLNSVVSAMSDGTLTGGTGKTLGKYTLVFDNGSNRATSTNEAMKAVLESVKITFSSTATVTNPYLYIDGYAANVAASSTVLPGSGSITWTNLSSLIDGGEIDGTVTLVVAGQVTTSGENQYIQTSIADLNGADGDDIQYDANGDDHAGSVTKVFISDTYVNGGTLSN